MRKLFTILFTGLSAIAMQSQNSSDAIIYAQDNLNGTARFSALSGAMGALGGDFSAISVNPAGSVIFANNQVGLSLTNYHTKNNSNYFGTNTSDKSNRFDLNQAGGVFVFSDNSGKNKNWKKFAVAINYETTKNLNSATFSAGTNPTNSIDDYFLYYANGIPITNIDGSLYNYDELFFEEQQAYLGYQSYIIDPANPVSYFTNVSTAGNYYQTNSVQTKGYTSKLAFNGSANYNDKLMIGLNLNYHFSDYRQSSRFTEKNTNPIYTTGSTVNNITFKNDLYTYGTGFSFQLGTIFKPTKSLRLGLAYDSPTWRELTDEFTQSVRTSGYGLSDTPNPAVEATIITDPNTTIVYKPYTLQTPGKLTGSMAYVFGKRGLISLDYGYKDYSKIKFLPKKENTDVNNESNNILTATSELRLGGEYKIKQWSLRGGYRFEQSPYKNSKTIGDLTGYSGGLGYNFGNTKVDFSYSNAKREYNQSLFSQGLTDAAKVNSNTNNISVTILFEL